MALTLFAYAAVRQFEFVDYDDMDYIVSNPHVTAGLTGDGIRWAFTSGYSANWHPLTWMSHMLDVQLFGMNAGLHHVVSLLMHVASTLVLFGTLRRMTGAVGKSAFVAALFALHPLHVESVAWVAERKDVLSTLFFMLALRAYAGYVARASWLRYLAVVVCFALGLLAKPMLVTLPLLLLLIDVWPLRRPLNVGLLREKVPLFALSAASAVVTLLVQRQGGAVQRLDQVPLALRVANAPIAYVHYIAKMFWPVNLVAMYPLPSETPTIEAFAAAALLVAISIAAIRAGRRYPYLTVGWLWYVIALLPVIGIVQVGAQSSADRYTYVPLIGLFVIVAWGVCDLAAARSLGSRILPVSAAAVVAACAFLSFRQVQHWRDSLALWEHAAEATPNNYFAHASLGYVLWKNGHTDQAMHHYRESISLRSNFAESHNNLGVALARQGQLRTALGEFSEALRLKPGFAAARDNMTATTARRASLDAEVAQYAEAVRSRPGDLAAHNDFGAALAAQSRSDEAADQFRAALQIDSSQADVHYNLGMVLERLGDTKEAVAHLRAALRADPKHAAASQALARLTSGPAGL